MADLSAPLRLLYIEDVAWGVERRHEMAQLMSRSAQRDPRLYLLFYGPNEEIRRIEVQRDLSADVGDDVLRALWEQAEVVPRVQR